MAKTVAVVTGAARRLGFEISKALLAQGYDVIALYRSATPELSVLQASGAKTICMDLADAASIHAGLEQIRNGDDIHLLVNNASEFSADPPDWNDKAAFASRLFQVNAIAPMLLIEGLAPQLKAASHTTGSLASIVNITDIFAERPNPLYTTYCASKAALANLTLSYAQSLAPDIRVNAIMPGPIKFLPDHSDAQRANVIQETLLAREGGFDCVVKQVIALADNDFITGAMIPVDGGRRLA